MVVRRDQLLERTPCQSCRANHEGPIRRYVRPVHEEPDVVLCRALYAVCRYLCERDRGARRAFRACLGGSGGVPVAHRFPELEFFGEEALAAGGGESQPLFERMVPGVVVVDLDGAVGGQSPVGWWAFRRDAWCCSGAGCDAGG